MSDRKSRKYADYIDGGEVEIHRAFSFHCDRCGRLLYTHAAQRWVARKDLTGDQDAYLTSIAPNASGLLIETVSDNLACHVCKILYSHCLVAD